MLRRARAHLSTANTTTIKSQHNTTPHHAKAHQTYYSGESRTVCSAEHGHISQPQIPLPSSHNTTQHHTTPRHTKPTIVERAEQCAPPSTGTSLNRKYRYLQHKHNTTQHHATPHHTTPCQLLQSGKLSTAMIAF